MTKTSDKVLWMMIYQLLRSQQRSVLRPLRIRATLMYVKGVRAARWTAFGLVGLCLLYIFLFGGFLLFHVGLFFYLPWTAAEKGCLFMGLGGGYVALTLLILAFALSQKRWMRMTGADKAVLEALRK